MQKQLPVVREGEAPLEPPIACEMRLGRSLALPFVSACVLRHATQRNSTERQRVTTSQQAIQNLYESPWQIALCLTGGGSRIASDLLTVPGASSTLLDVAIPYSSGSLTEYLGKVHDQYCSRETALRMATVAWQRALQFSESTKNDAVRCLGVSCTASLASSKPKRGEHRIWIATESASSSRVVSLILRKGLRTRLAEEAVAAELLLYAINDGCGLTPPALPSLNVDETVSIEFETVDPVIAQLRSGDRAVAWALPGGSVSATISQPPRGLLPGSFNPIHIGHHKLRTVADDLIGGPVHFELSLVNADKPPLNCFEIEQRRHQFDDVPLALTAASLFVDKARLFPGAIFVIGYDTAVRILDPRFYQDSQQNLQTSLEAVGSLGCSFLVAGRLTESGFQSINDLPVPTEFQDLFQSIPEDRFREDVSSSGIRNAANAKLG